MGVKKNIYFFGDSFTFGWGCSPHINHDYKKLYPPKKSDLLWTDIVADRLNGNPINLGQPGCSMDDIFYQLIKHMNQIKDDDIVIISNGLVERLNIYANWYALEQPEHTLLDTNQIVKKPLLMEMLADGSYDSLLSRERIKNLVDYITLNLSPYSSEIIKDFNTRVRYVELELRKRNVDFFRWNWNDIEPFEKILEATNGVVNDGHFSWEGHRQFAKFFLKEYVNLEIYYNII